MGLLSFLRREPAAPTPTTKRGKKAAGSDGLETLQRLRQQARRRLLGAAVLVGIGIVAFPLVFETQPRPVPMDLPIVIPAKEATATPQPAPAALPSQLPDDAEVQAVAEAASLPEPAAPPARSSEPLPQAEAPKPKAEAVKPKAEPATPKVAAAAKPASSAAPGGARYVVQVGAFADKQAAQVARQKLERKGLKTYAQVAKTPQGERIRVRLGPFATKADADKAAQQAKAVGLAGAVLTL